MTDDRIVDQPTPTVPDSTDDLWAFVDEAGEALTIPKLIPSRRYPEGRQYTVDSPDALDGLRLSGIAEILAKRAKGIPVSERDMARLQIGDEQKQREWSQQVLGDTFEQMMADGVKWRVIQAVTNYAFFYFGMNPQAAEDAARNGLLSGNTPPPANRAERRGAKGASSGRQGSPGSKKPRKGKGQGRSTRSA